MKPCFVAPILQKIAPRAGITLVLEPSYHYAGQMIFPDGRKRFFKHGHFDLNFDAACEVANDKAYAAHFMKTQGYSTIPGEAFFCPRWAEKIKSDRGPEAAWAYAQSLGLPVIVKPNNLSQGSGVAKVHDREEFFAAVESYSDYVRVFLVEQLIKGDDYRIVVLDNEVISAYRRIALNVTGDGTRTIRQLMEAKQEHYRRTGRDTMLKFDDARIIAKLARTYRSLDCVPARDEYVQLLDNANLSCGGDAVDVTSIIHPSFRDMAVNLTRDMGLRLCGVDLMTKGAIDAPLANYHIIEINAAPGLDHYASLGDEQVVIVEELYLKVLNAMKNTP